MYLNLLSLLVLSVVALGLIYRKQRRKHVSFMLAAFSIDIAMVLYIELTREAIATAMAPPHPFVTFHIIISVIAVLGYLFQLFTGLQIIKGKINLIKLHKISAMTFIVFRLANFITSLWVEEFTRKI